MGQIATIDRRTTSLTRWSEPQLPARLHAAVAGTENVFTLPVPQPRHRDVLQAFVDAHAGLPMPSVDEVEGMLTRLAIALPRAKTDGAVAEAKLDIYGEALADVALPDLQAAYAKLIREARFFPTVAEIRAAAAPTANRRAWALARAKALIGRHEREWRPEAEPLTAAEQDELSRILTRTAARHPKSRKGRDGVPNP